MQAWLSKRITILSLVPVVLLCVMMVFTSHRSALSLNGSQQTIDELNLAVLTYSLLSEIQKERGMSAGYIGSQGASFKTELSAQRNKVDSQLSKLRAAKELSTVTFAQNSLMRPLDTLVNNMKSWRENVSSLSASVPATVKNYTQIAQLLINFKGGLVNYANDSEAKQKFVLLYNLAGLQEASGLERAMLSNIFAIKTPSPEQVNTHASNIAKQASLLFDLETLATPEFKQSLTAFSNASTVRAVEPYRLQLSNYPAKALSADSEQWFSISTARIGELAKLISALFSQIETTAFSTYDNALLGLVVSALLLVISLVLMAAIYIVLKSRQAQSSELKNKLKDIMDKRDLTKVIKRKSNDDLGEVANMLNQLITLFKCDLLEFKTAANEITSVCDQVAQSSNETHDNIGVQQQNVGASLVSTEILSAGINADLENINNVATYTKQSANSVKQGEELVSKAVQDIHDTASEVNNIGQSIELLNDKVGDILKMVDVIRSVAEQTNLLALNAAIEAARAGEQGRGFAVVADEVRALAKRVQDSTHEIATTVEELRVSSSHAFDAVAKGVSKANNSVSLADEIKSALNNIADNINNLEEFSIAVEQSAKQQSFSLDDVTKGIREIDAMSGQNTDGAQRVAVASSELAATAASMLSNIKRYST